jgi:oligoendopeptidase F
MAVCARDGRYCPPFLRPQLDRRAEPSRQDTGAFAHPTVPSAHPYVLVNYLGKPRDVMTLAHELGHGVHQVLAGDQGALMALDTADAGGNGQRVRRDADLPPCWRRPPIRRERKAMLASKAEDMINTVVRQIAFYTFERKVHMKLAGKAS